MTEKNPPRDNVADTDQPESNEAMPDTNDGSHSDTKTAPDGNAANQQQAPKHAKIAQTDDMGIVIVDDDIRIDQEKINEERRAYLEEARSQEAFD